MRKIKTFLIVGILISFIASFCELVFTNDYEMSQNRQDSMESKSQDSNLSPNHNINGENIESNLQDSTFSSAKHNINEKDSIESKSHKSTSSTIFFAASLIGQFIFLGGLFLIDRKAKSLLSGYYATLICICVILYFLPKSEDNTLTILLVTLFFFFLLYRYLRIWTRLSGISLFIYSFYALILCIICGIFVLKFGFVEARAVASFIVVFMIAPALIMYFSAIFSLKSITFHNLEKVIK
ncbi:hypothetical protein DCO58_01035 [Helicobacter saguini]|uniref:Uncharacterized protein n=1 Tax=Helicobacter saguini TaxID=1548018 RepID=A0A347VR56_9HELI|nr:hypothetical protein [Helicobacter saguini]MWV63027.1 hypothetical protein [Helicobacter saguini]MWV66304.1 hypothetical protein [Helicobacter saguini]MWV68656.1 hypothetical protein [Helicobacter saguini]MWV71793.1 hypothetical protein [Helicobacter saguini]TLD95821.1 hypothetical protein LS64_000150 [Helicobacter saguini]